MNYLELCQQVVEDAGISGNFETVVNQTGEFARVANWVNRASQAIESKWFDWDFLAITGAENVVPTVIGVQDYPAPTLLNKWDEDAFIRVDGNQQLVYYPWVRVKNQRELNEPGDPYGFTILPNKTIRLFGIPQTVENLEFPYWLKPRVLAADLDNPQVPEQFRMVIVYKALQYYANYESAEEVKLQAEEGLAEWMRKLESHSAPGRQGGGNVNTGIDIQVQAESSNYEYY